MFVFLLQAVTKGLNQPLHQPIAFLRKGAFVDWGLTAAVRGLLVAHHQHSPSLLRPTTPQEDLAWETCRDPMASRDHSYDDDDDDVIAESKTENNSLGRQVKKEDQL